MKKRAAFYIDGFNLYHGIEEIKQNHLKWVCIRSLCLRIMPKETEEIARITYCTAYKRATRGDTNVQEIFDKLARHQQYVRALKSTGVTVEEGHFIREPRECKNCRHNWREAAEKETDLNVGLSVLNDAHKDVFDVAYLFSGDSDQAATARFLKTHFPQKRLVSVAPPNRRLSDAVLEYADASIVLTEAHIERCLLGPTLFNPDGSVLLRRPPAYATPSGWTPPV